MKSKSKPPKLYSGEVSAVPYSSVVGRSLTISIPGVGVTAMLIISVPQPHLDYKTVADAVCDALTTYGTSKGEVTLVLPHDFVEAARAHLSKAGE